MVISLILFIANFTAWKFVQGRGFADKAYTFIGDTKKLNWKTSYWLLVSKVPCFLYMSAPIGYIHSWPLAGALFTTLLLPSLVGWGKAMIAMNELRTEEYKQNCIYRSNNEKEFKPIDDMTNMLYGNAQTHEEARLKIVLWTALYSFLFYYPLFICMAVFIHPLSLVWGSFVIYLGLIVYVSKEWVYFEIASAALISTLVSIVLLIGRLV